MTIFILHSIFWWIYQSYLRWIAFTIFCGSLLHRIFCNFWPPYASPSRPYFLKSICFYFPVQSIFGVPGVHLSKDPGYRSSAFSHNSGKSRRQSMLLWEAKRISFGEKNEIFWNKKKPHLLIYYITAQKVVFAPLSLLFPILSIIKFNFWKNCDVLCEARKKIDDIF